MAREQSGTRGTFAPPPKPELITSLGSLRSFLATVCSSARLYIELHGHRLSRLGDLTLMTVRAYPHPEIYVIDIQSLGHEAFTARSVFGLTLQSVLENPGLRKVFWDVRDAADALWGHHGVRIQGVVDLQLLENASRRSRPPCEGPERHSRSGNGRGTGRGRGGVRGRSQTYVQDLDTAIRRDLSVSAAEGEHIARLRRVMASRLSLTAFRLRPLDDDTAAFCANGIRYLPQLHTVYMERITGEWLRKVKMETFRRLEAAFGPPYDPQSPTKALGPWADTKKPGPLFR
ncbi:hypothetical protein SPBR_04393 [Sporothrix brasiliensis 5110]|uniref:3'-5' exonuclease domain-containing protein n=1 Tax=Sporothrix brasiliensis 5110 TaxID=1398154 RepID=A0A0C2F455_9PEZI|nr:uncharacterized protein SPBR_04393 [Sporothrix brasiliensis 5110]KIH93669.1 hypothetical protein SPBR_04393 [Sporothrix brasiliensis 5110]